ncbi:MAG: 50S ribosomal protein L10 [Rhodospirillaceae bacterium]|nr:50S ribosomal protein L10 [Rhodospirillaceae bacterium]
MRWTGKSVFPDCPGKPTSNGYVSYSVNKDADSKKWRRSVDRTEKEDLVSQMHQVFEDTSIVVVTHYSGLTVAEMGELRTQMRDAGAQFKVTKNRLTRLALDGTKFSGLNDLFTGPTAIAYSEDPVAAAKAAVNFAKTNEKLVVLGGALGEDILDVNAVKNLATLPSLDEIRGKIVGLLNAPATKIAGVLQAPAGQLARVVSAHSEQGEAA